MFKYIKVNVNKTRFNEVYLNKIDMRKLRIENDSKIKVYKNNEIDNYKICIVKEVDYSEEDKKSKGKVKTKKTTLKIKKCEIGLPNSIIESLSILRNDKINIIANPKPTSLIHIEKRFNENISITYKGFLEILKDIVEENYSDIETTYFVLACSKPQLSLKETIDLSKAMIDIGQRLVFKKTKNNIVLDKHCIGGLAANRTTMVVIPIIAALGYTIPKTSSRSITSPSGTADTMEVLANVNLDISQMINIVNKNNACICWGGSVDLSPADDKIINVEHPLEIDSIGQMVASVLSKKVSAGSTHCLIDIPVGETAKINSYKRAKSLKRTFLKVAKAIGLKLKVIITEGSEPIGNGIGPLYEAKDVLKVLKNEEDCSLELKEKSIYMAGILLKMAGEDNSLKKCQNKARLILESQNAYKKFLDICKSQKQNKLIPDGEFKLSIKSNKIGIIEKIDNRIVSKLAFVLGAPEDKAAGLILKKKLGDEVVENDILYEIYSNSQTKLNYALSFIKNNGNGYIVE